MTPELTVRALDPAEWPRLQRTGMDLAAVQDASALGSVIVVEEAGVIVACGVVLLCAHLEGLWVHPARRGHLPILRRLWHALKSAVRATGAKGVCCSAVTSSSAEMIRRMGGTQLHGNHYVAVLRGSR